MERLQQREFDIMEALQQAPAQGLYFADLARLSIDPVRLHKALNKLVKRNYLTAQHCAEGAYFCITAQNRPLVIRRVACPICKAIRRTHRDDQHAIHCSNPNCKTPSGRHRTFWLVNIDHLRRGVVKKINYVQ